MGQSTYHSRMEFTGLEVQRDGVRVQPFLPRDAEGVLDAVVESGADLSRYETWSEPPFTIDNAKEYVRWWTEGWEERTAFFFAVTDTADFLGACGIFDLQPGPSGSMGYWVRSAQTGHGLATEVASLVAHWGFQNLGLTFIDLQVSDSNPASVRVAQKIGAERVGDLDDRLPLSAEDSMGSLYRLSRPSPPARD